MAVTAAAVAYSHFENGDGSYLGGRIVFWRKSRGRIRGGISRVRCTLLSIADFVCSNTRYLGAST